MSQENVELILRLIEVFNARDLETLATLTHEDAGDDSVACAFRMVGKGKRSGAPVDREVGLTYRIRDGRVWRMRSYLDPAEALEAVGLTMPDADRGAE